MLAVSLFCQYLCSKVPLILYFLGGLNHREYFLKLQNVYIYVWVKEFWKVILTGITPFTLETFTIAPETRNTWQINSTLSLVWSNIYLYYWQTSIYYKSKNTIRGNNRKTRKQEFFLSFRCCRKTPMVKTHPIASALFPRILRLWSPIPAYRTSAKFLC